MSLGFTRGCKKTFGVFILSITINCLNAQLLKSVVYDFDGLDIGQNNLPEGDFGLGDMSYQISVSPLSQNDMIGDRVLKLNLNWNTGFGIFGRGTSRYIELDVNQDKFNFFFYNPVANNQNASFDVILTDDDDQSNTFDYAMDDVWKKSLTISGSAGWLLVSVPLSEFVDSNPGGNSIFDIAFTGNKGMLLSVEYHFFKSAGISNPVFYLDMINFSDGILPRGTTELDLPYKSPSDYCLLGAYQSETTGQNNLIPVHVESLFPAVPGKKLKYVNFFVDFASDGTTIAKDIPRSDVQTLIDNGYMPIITWEPMFKGFPRLDPVQPNLNNIINGDYNTYIDQFADKIKTYTDTVIIRFMHEFEGDWYSWSISKNGNDPSKYITAFRKVVDAFRARGATKVKWMWCINSDYAPYRYFNWIVPAYPGDNYVDIIANDIYNNHFPITDPWWKSFRKQIAETYYYINKYFPRKPLYMCELGCRERFAYEDPSSETKGAWYERMDKELQSNFHKVRALIFFNGSADQNWVINSSPGAISSLITNIWSDDYYFNIPVPGGIKEHEYGSGLYVYPNPTNQMVTITYASNKVKEGFAIRILNSSGQLVYQLIIKESSDSFLKQIDLSALPKGIYLVELLINAYNRSRENSIKETRKLILQ
jgi:hypothetical protein